MPALSSLHIDQALTNVSIMYRNENYIADQVFPTLPVDKRSDKYFIYDPATMLQGTATDANGRPKSLRRPKTRAAELDLTLSNDNYYAEEYALAGLVSDAEVRIADNPLQPAQDETEFLTERVTLDWEIFVAKTVGTAGNYPTANKTTLTTGGSGTSWASYGSASSKPLKNINAAKVQILKSIMREGNMLALTVDTARTLADHPDVLDLIKYTSSEALTRSGLPRVIRGCNVLEGAGQKGTSAEGATFASGNIWLDSGGNNMALVYYKSEQVGPKSIHFGRTFEPPDDTTGTRGFSVRRWRDEPRKGEMVEVSTTRDAKFIAVDSSGKALGGYLFLSATV